MDPPSALLHSDKAAQKSPFMALAGETPAHEKRPVSSREPKATLERVDHHFGGQVFGGDRELSLGPEIANGAGQRQRLFW